MNAVIAVLDIAEKVAEEIHQKDFISDERGEKLSTKCPACSRQGLIWVGGEVGREHRQLVECHECDLRFTIPVWW